LTLVSSRATTNTLTQRRLFVTTLSFVKNIADSRGERANLHAF